jgi:hypothetical protein
MSSSTRVLVALSLTTLAMACGPDESLSPTISTGAEGKLLRRGTVWSLTAPVSVKIPPGAAEWKLTAMVKEEPSAFLRTSQNQRDIPVDAAVFEVPLEISREPQRGMTSNLTVIVTAHTWNGGLETAVQSAIGRYTFVFE